MSNIRVGGLGTNYRHAINLMDPRRAIGYPTEKSLREGHLQGKVLSEGYPRLRKNLFLSLWHFLGSQEEKKRPK